MKRQKLEYILSSSNEEDSPSSSGKRKKARSDLDTLFNSVFCCRLTPFTKVVRNREYVDKSLFIKEFLDETGIVVLTAPPRFIKTTNLDMLKYFLEIEVDSEGNRKTSETGINKPIKDTPNYTLFTRQKLKITQEKEIMRKYFGKYPVIHINMSCSRYFILSFKNLLGYCQNFIFSAFKRHKYLIKSNKLNKKEKEIIKLWCRRKLGDEKSIINGLKILSIYLYKHFQTKVFILIDAYDDPIEQSMCRIKTPKELNRCIKLLSNIFSQVFNNNNNNNNNNTYIAGGLIFGVVYISDFFSSLKNVKSFRFLDNHSFVSYFGLDQEDANKLFSKQIFELNSTKIRYIKSVFKGYRNSEGNLQIYHLASVIYFLLYEDCKPFQRSSDYEINLRHIFKIPIIKKYFTRLLRGRPITIKVKKDITIEDLLTLYNISELPLLVESTFIIDLFFSVLLQIGFLTYTINRIEPLSSGLYTLEIPNVQVYIHLKTRLCFY